MVLSFEIASAVLTPGRASTLTFKAQQSRHLDAHFTCADDGSVCRVECSRDMAVVLATDIILWGSAAELSADDRAACENAMNTLLGLLQHSQADAAAESEVHDRSA